MVKLTPKQLRIVEFIRQYERENRMAPTLHEIAEHMGTSKVTVFEHMRALEQKGAIRRSHYKSRSIELSPKLAVTEDERHQFPLVGTIAAGQPIEAIELPDTIDITALFEPRKAPYVLRVRGNSMIDEQIRDGDFVIIERRETANNGETVVAVMPNGEATLKKFYREKDRVRLQPANATMAPIYVEDCQIQGVVIGVLRKY